MCGIDGIAITCASAEEDEKQNYKQIAMMQTCGKTRNNNHRHESAVLRVLSVSCFGPCCEETAE